MGKEESIASLHSVAGEWPMLLSTAGIVVVEECARTLRPPAHQSGIFVVVVTQTPVLLVLNSFLEDAL